MIVFAYLFICNFFILLSYLDDKVTVGNKKMIIIIT